MATNWASVSPDWVDSAAPVASPVVYTALCSHSPDWVDSAAPVASPVVYTALWVGHIRPRVEWESFTDLSYKRWTTCIEAGFGGFG